MAVANAHLVIYQGSTFKRTILCDLSDQSIATIATWATGANTFHLSVGSKGDANFKAVATGVVTFSGNNAQLEIDEAVTALFTDTFGRFVVEATNNTDRWPVIRGSWELARDSA